MTQPLPTPEWKGVFPSKGGTLTIGPAYDRHAFALYVLGRARPTPLAYFAGRDEVDQALKALKALSGQT